MNRSSRRTTLNAIAISLALVLIAGLFFTLRAFGLLPHSGTMNESSSHPSSSTPGLSSEPAHTPSEAAATAAPLPHSPNRPETAPADVAEKRREEGRAYNNPGGVESFRKLIELYKQPHSGTITLRAQSHRGAALVTLRSPSLPQNEPGDYGTKQFAIPGGYTWEETISITTIGQSVWQIDVTPLDRGIEDNFSCATLLEGHPNEPYTTANGPSAHCTVTGKTPEEIGYHPEGEPQP